MELRLFVSKKPITVMFSLRSLAEEVYESEMFWYHHIILFVLSIVQTQEDGYSIF